MRKKKWNTPEAGIAQMVLQRLAHILSFFGQRFCVNALICLVGGFAVLSDCGNTIKNGGDSRRNEVLVMEVGWCNRCVYSSTHFCTWVFLVWCAWWFFCQSMYSLLSWLGKAHQQKDCRALSKWFSRLADFNAEEIVFMF